MSMPIKRIIARIVGCICIKVNALASQCHTEEVSSYTRKAITHVLGMPAMQISIPGFDHLNESLARNDNNRNMNFKGIQKKKKKQQMN